MSTSTRTRQAANLDVAVSATLCANGPRDVRIVRPRGQSLGLFQLIGSDSSTEQPAPR